MTRRLWVPLLALLLLAPAVSAAPKNNAKAKSNRSVKVELLGIDGALKENALLLMTIADEKQRKKATDAELRQMHARAEQQIRSALQPFGYYRPLIHSELQTDGQWIARYEIEAGPPILLDSVFVKVTGEGAVDPNFQKRVDRFPLHKGDVLLHQSYEFGKDSLESYAAEGGYLDASFITNRILVDLERYTSSIALVYDTGPRHYFGDVHFDDGIIDPKVLVRFLDFRRGDRFDFRKLLQLQTDLSNTGYFSKVDVTPNAEEIEHTQVPIAVRLSAARKLRFSGGVGYGTDDGARARILTELRRTNREGHRAQAEFQYGLRDKHAGLQYFVPWPRPRTDVLALSTGYQDLRTVTAKSRYFQSGVSLSRLLGRWRVVPALTYRRETFTVGSDHGTVASLLPEGTWSRIRLDDPTFTKNGDRIRLNARGAQSPILSDVSLVQTRFDTKWIKALSDRSRGLARLEIGATRTADFHRLPASLRFFAGGINSVRGYSFNSLGQRDSLGNVIGGRYLAVGSLEVDHRFMDRLGAALFFDYGNAVNTFRTPLKRGAGVGLRFISPAGLVRADFGWGLDRRGTPLEVHLAVGSEL